MTDTIFTSYCFGESYLEQQFRLRESILKIYPHANLHFVNEPESTGKPKFQKSLYGFKVDMVKECRKRGFSRIVFFDTAITLIRPIDYWFTITSAYGILAPVDRQTLNTVTSNDCLRYLSLDRDRVSEWNLVGGSVYIFDFNFPLCDLIWKQWERLERDGLFGKQDDLSNNRLQSHRMDETCMALAMKLNGSGPLGHDKIRYAYEHPQTKIIHGNVNEMIVCKKHFK